MKILSLRDNPVEASKYVVPTLEQITKDFGMCGVSIRFPLKNPPEYAEIHRRVRECLEKTFNEDYSRFLSLIYRIDIPERDMKSMQRSVSFFEDITEAIIRREFLKVLIRESYSRGNDKELPG
jgi:hypothetical protein